MAELKGEVTATTDELAAAVIAVQTDSGAAADKLSAVDRKLKGLAQQQTLMVSEQMEEHAQVKATSEVHEQVSADSQQAEKMTQQLLALEGELNSLQPDLEQSVESGGAAQSEQVAKQSEQVSQQLQLVEGELTVLREAVDGVHAAMGGRFDEVERTVAESAAEATKLQMTSAQSLTALEAELSGVKAAIEESTDQKLKALEVEMTVQSQAKSAAALEGDAASVSSDAVALLTRRIANVESAAKKQLAELKANTTEAASWLAAETAKAQEASAQSLSALEAELSGVKEMSSQSLTALEVEVASMRAAVLEAQVYAANGEQAAAKKLVTLGAKVEEVSQRTTAVASEQDEVDGKIEASALATEKQLIITLEQPLSSMDARLSEKEPVINRIVGHIADQKARLAELEKSLTDHINEPGIHLGGGGSYQPPEEAEPPRPVEPVQIDYDWIEALAKYTKDVLDDSGHDTAADAFRALDKDGDGSITVAEFKKGLEGLGGELDEEAITHLVEAIDQDGDGEISLSEFKAAFAPHEASPPSTPHAGDEETDQVDKETRRTLTRSESEHPAGSESRGAGRSMACTRSQAFLLCVSTVTVTLSSAMCMSRRLLSLQSCGA